MIESPPTPVNILTHPAYLILGFVVFLILFHWVYLRKKLDEISIKRIDYYWLTFALLGIITASEPIRQEWYKRELIFADYHRKVALHNLKQHSKTLTSTVLCRQLIDNGFIKDIDLKQKQYNFACDFFKNATVEIFESNDDRNVGFLVKDEPFKINISDNYLIYMFDKLKEYNDKFVERIKEQQEIEDLTRKGLLASLCSLAYPFLLVIAIALRTTKVSCEILLIKKKK